MSLRASTPTPEPLAPPREADLGSGTRPRHPGAIRRASREARRTSRLTRMPRWLRVFLTGFSFAMFFAATISIGLLSLPVLLFVKTDRRRLTRRINASQRMFAGFMRDVGLITYWPPVLPEGYEGKGFLLIANHPSLIDVVLTLSSLPELTCVASGYRYHNFIFGRMLRRTDFIPGVGMEGDEGVVDDSPVVRRIEERLREGVPVLVFPEGTRSGPRELRRFRRGAIEAAVRAGVPILPMFIALDTPFLMKGQKFWDCPKVTARYSFEWLGDPIETVGLDSRALTKTLAARYQARFDALLEERDALARELERDAS